MKEQECSYVGRYISQIQRKGTRYITCNLAPYGIGYGQFLFLIQLYRKDGIRQEELAENLNIDKGTTARALKKLEDEGFITRTTDKDDKRANRVNLTEKALSLRENVFSVARSWESKVTKNLNQEEKDTIMKLLDKICTD
ncbi:MarR family winged helix-turn-helix transcriptional regulator [Clostridium sp.]|uniref:MarR family winged helix-turn-helix transcriptional regulator n=1 Tax=Clostridium sp. TaxID=1506 RepID=UPI003F2B6646